MELTQLYYFQMLAKEEHFTRAADHLHITQPTLSKSIANLENELGVQLFDRDKGAVRLNVYGQLFLRYINEMMICLEDGKRNLSALLNNESGEITVAVTVNAALSPLLRDFLIKHPGIHMHQIQSTAQEAVSLLETHMVDFAITILPINSLSIIWTPLKTEQQGIVVSRLHHLANRSSIRLSELADERFLMSNANTDLRSQFLTLCEKAGFYPNIFFEGDQSDMIGELIEKNFGVSISSLERHLYNHQLAIANGARPKDIVYLPIDDVDCSRTFGVAKLRNHTMSAASASFYDFILDRFHVRRGDEEHNTPLE